MGANTSALLAVLDDVRALLARHDNDFSWSSFANAQAALQEIDALYADGLLFELSVLFTPTGPIQEVSASSGWSEEFLTLAERFDAAVADTAAP